MASIIEHDPDSKSAERASVESKPTHLVCDCQVDASPRLALCLADCSDAPQRTTTPETVCVVCENLGYVAAYIGCEFCRDSKWSGIF